MTTVDINYAAVLVSAASGMVIGGIWYSPAVFAKPWMKLTGMKDMTPADGAIAGYLTAFTGTLIAAYVLAHFVGYAGATTPADGAVIGLWAWLGFTGPAFLSTYTFSKRPHKLWAIDTLQYLAIFVVMGIILASWHK